MKKALLIFLFLGLMGFVCQGNDGVPVAISPGIDGGVGSVESRCPAFSWSGVAWAEKYRVVVFRVEDAVTKLNDEMKLSAKPLLSADIAGRGLSWTPSASKGLAAGADYVWYVGAMDAGGAWAWSASRRFRVEASAKLALAEEDMSVSKQQVSKGEASDEKSLRTAAGSSAGTAAGKKGKVNDPAYGSEGALSTFYGTGAGANNSSDGNFNSFFGSGAGYTNTIGTNNTYMGRGAGYSNSTGTRNSFIGYYAGYSNTVETENTFLGCFSGQANSGGYYNTFLGKSAGRSNTSGNHNVFVSCDAGYANTTGNYNTIIGRAAGYSNITGSRNIFLGYMAGYNETGSDKLYIEPSGITNPLIYGDFSADKVGINGWLGIGTTAPAYPFEVKSTGVNVDIVVNRTDGASFKLSAMGASGQLGTITSHPVNFMTNNVKRLTIAVNGRVGIGVTLPDYPLHMASGAYCTTGGVWTDSSSIRLKENIASLSSEKATAALQGLNPVTYNYKADKAEKYVGFIAEEVPELVAMNDRKALSPMDIVAVLTKVTQDQQQTIENLSRKMQELTQKQQRINEKMKKEIAELKKKRSK